MDIDKSELNSILRSLDNTEFEKLLADLWEDEGWDTRVTSGQRDSGIDVIATRDSPIKNKYLIQAKRYSITNKVGSPEIREYAGLLQQEDNVDSVIVATTSSFTSEAQNVAEKSNVKLLSCDDISALIIESDITSSIYEYANEEHLPGSTDEPDKDGEIVSLAPINGTEYRFVHSAQQAIQETFDLNVEIEDPVDSPPFGYNPEREQYNAEDLILVASPRPESAEKTMLLTNSDIYHGNLNYTFGVSYLDGDHALVSTYRIKRNQPHSSDISALRLKKEVVKNVAHMYGIGSCNDPRCMNYSVSTIQGLDATDFSFCEGCQDQLGNIGIIESE